MPAEKITVVHENCRTKLQKSKVIDKNLINICPR